MSEETNQPQERQLTPEEISVRKSEMMAYWKAEMPFLKAQVAFETLQTELEELRARQVFAHVKTANLLAAPPQEEAPKPVGNPVPPGPRKLKTEPIAPVVNPAVTTVA